MKMILTQCTSEDILLMLCTCDDDTTDSVQVKIYY